MNKSLKAWVAFVKRVQKQEKLTYKDAIHRAKVRKDKGEKWMHGGEGCTKMGGEEPPMKMGGEEKMDDSSMKMDNGEQPMKMDDDSSMKMSGGIYRATGQMRRTGGKRSTAKKSKRRGKMTKKRRTRRH